LFYDLEKEEEMKSSNEEDLPCSTVEDEGATEDKTMMHVEDTQFLKSPSQEETNTISYPPLHDFDNSLLYDLGNEEDMDEPLNFLNASCYDTDSDIVNIMISYMLEDIVSGMWLIMVWTPFNTPTIQTLQTIISKCLSLQLSQQVTLDFDQWQQGDDTITDTFQTPKVDLVS
jgi:hypothetical protein